MDLLTDLIESYLREVVVTVMELHRQNKGREIIRPVPGRSSTEDMTIGIDKACEEVLKAVLSEYPLRVRVFSEDKAWGPTRRLDLICSVDPFDGSGLFLRDIERDWWSALTFFDPYTRTPVAGGAVDILARKIYLADEAGVTLVSLEDGSRVFISPAKDISISSETVIAAYLMNWKYLASWAARMRPFFRRFPGTFVWANGGSCIYPWIAEGRVRAYIMWREPRSEVDSGLAFPHFARYPVFSVKKGELIPYRFEPGRGTGRVPLLIAACAEELARQILDAITIK